MPEGGPPHRYVQPRVGPQSCQASGKDLDSNGKVSARGPNHAKKAGGINGSRRFLLRVPSEALTVRFGETGTPYGQRTGKAIHWDDGEGGQGIRFENNRRKN